MKIILLLLSLFVFVSHAKAKTSPSGFVEPNTKLVLPKSYDNCPMKESGVIQVDTGIFGTKKYIAALAEYECIPLALDERVVILKMYMAKIVADSFKKDLFAALDEVVNGKRLLDDGATRQEVFNLIYPIQVDLKWKDELTIAQKQGVTKLYINGREISSSTKITKHAVEQVRGILHRYLKKNP